jgi:hypothetical protein
MSTAHLRRPARRLATESAHLQNFVVAALIESRCREFGLRQPGLGLAAIAKDLDTGQGLNDSPSP